MLLQPKYIPLRAPWFLPDVLTPFARILVSTSKYPVQTIIAIAILASTTYIALLEASLFDQNPELGVGYLGFGRSMAWTKDALVGSVTLKLMDRGLWHQVDSDDIDRLMLVTLTCPSHTKVDKPVIISNTSEWESVVALPNTSDSFAYAVSEAESTRFLSSLDHLKVPGSYVPHATDPTKYKAKMWVVKQIGGENVESFERKGNYLRETYERFKSLLFRAEPIDVLIMALGYLAMYATFGGLFMAMRRLGSNFWLFFAVLLSSIFAFFFAGLTTYALGVPMNMVVLSEGLPFLVVIIGFDKTIGFTQAVLEESASSRKKVIVGDHPGSSGRTIQSAVIRAVKQKSFQIILQYILEIAFVCIGAATKIQGGFRQFCFLAAWILIWDCIMLFTFYTAILSIKLEINRIKRHVTVRKQLEDDGVSRKVAEKYAQSSEWPKVMGDDGEVIPQEDLFQDRGTNILGLKVKDSSIRKFKIIMVVGFFAANLFVNFFDASLLGLKKDGASTKEPISSKEVDVSTIAQKGLDLLGGTRPIGTLVQVLHPIVYQLKFYPMRQTISPSRNTSLPLDGSSYLGQVTRPTSELFVPGAIGARVIDRIDRSISSPLIGKCLIGLLLLSLLINAYLFNAAKWSVKDIPDKENKFIQTRERRKSIAQLDRATLTKDEKTNGESPEALKQALMNVRLLDKEEPTSQSQEAVQDNDHDDSIRDINDLRDIFKAGKLKTLKDSEILRLVEANVVAERLLEKQLDDDLVRAVKIRRNVYSRLEATKERTVYLAGGSLPYAHYDYSKVGGACCENVVGYMPIPVGLAGPLVINGESFHIPMATTEGVLVASTSRGAKAINSGGGATAVLTADGMTRGPCVQFPSLAKAAKAKIWIDSKEGFSTLAEAFNSTSNYARLQSLKTALAGTYLFIRFKTATGDAMGMNMISKGVEKALDKLMHEPGFEDMEILTISGNYCTDKKAAAINWIDGRGKSVVAEAIIPRETVEKTLKTTVEKLVEINTSKNLIGSAMAGSIGGNNAHAANIVAAIFIATGQDPAQVVESSSCITVMSNNKGNLQISVSMPCIEVGTIGGGTILDPQGAMLEILGIRGPHPTTPGQNSQKLALIIASAVLAGELSLISALANQTLVKSHMAHNRSAVPTRATTPAITSASGTPLKSKPKMLEPLAEAVDTQVNGSVRN